jgi:hypothetical protein
MGKPVTFPGMTGHLRQNTQEQHKTMTILNVCLLTHLQQSLNDLFYS